MEFKLDTAHANVNHHTAYLVRKMHVRHGHSLSDKNATEKQIPKFHRNFTSVASCVRIVTCLLLLLLLYF